MAIIDVTIPDIGDFDEVAVIELLVKAGDKVRAEQSLITVESDKASMEIPSSHAGVVKELQVKLGDKVKQGSIVLKLETADVAAAAPVAAAAVAPVAAIAPVVAAPPVAVAAVSVAAAVAHAAVAVVAAPAHQPATALSGDLPHASPSVRKFARELGVPLNEVKGSGPKGRISQEDIQSFNRAVMTGETRTQAQVTKAPAGDGAGLGLIPWPKVDFAKFGPIERKELGRIQKISGANLLRNAVMIPAVTNHDDADITELEAFRVQTNLENEKAAKAGINASVKVTMLAFLIKACVNACKNTRSSTARWMVMRWFTNITGTSVLPQTHRMV